ncbi:rubredoxin [Monoraphidium neglectum]|uniref:Rubredoxin n=1 Tax=Monoraphidium neglectum TaxID=145388 RepID=A0A0D2N5J7_9CHLO|nr:rubredoxin [Monoraphidium neglectum]KIZ07547.1 rubredoxin [Monoraphidium neglectum]|eukprot:XP_013906566.1 rubredoxin [Monoraphidium neglectum]
MQTSMRGSGLRSHFMGAQRASLVRPVAASRTRQQVATQALFGFGAKKEDAGAAPKLYICIQCGWIYDGDFPKAPGSFKCPACQAPKSRFKIYKGKLSGKVSNTGAAMKQRFQAKQW